MRALLALAIALAIAAPAEAQQMSRGRRSASASADSGLADVFRFTAPAALGGTLQGTRGEAITFTRASSKYCPQAVGAVTVLANDVPCIYDGRILFEDSSTNRATYSLEIGGTNWTLTNATLSADSATSPWGTAVADRITSTGTNGRVSQAVAISSSAGPHTHAAWGNAVTGTHQSYIGITCTGSTPSACSCRREDGVLCVAATSGAECRGDSTFSTTPTRVWVTATCAAPVTSVTLTLGAGSAATGSGESHIWVGDQFETVRKYPTTFVATTNAAVTRQPDIAMVPTTAAWPIATGAMSATFVPAWGATGTPTGVAGIMGNPYNQTSPTNGWSNAVFSNGALVSDMRLNSASSIQLSSATTWTHGQPYNARWTWAAAGTATFSKDGTALTGATHAGASMPTSIKTPMQIGGFFNGYLDGWISALCVSASVDGCASTSVASAEHPILWLSDSIMNMNELYTAAATYPVGSRVTNHRGTYSGQVVGAGLLEVADASYAYTSEAWRLQQRSTPLSAYRGLVFLWGRNDSTVSEDLNEFRKAYDKILAQGYRYFPRVVSSTPPPKAVTDRSAWDLASDAYDTGGYRSAVATLVTKWNGRHADHYGNFLADVTAGRHTIAELMSDTLHPSTTAGVNLIAQHVQLGLFDGTAATVATPEIGGQVVNYLFGQPTVGSWSLTAVSSMPNPGAGPLGRIAGLSDVAQQISASGAKLTFPATEASQVWVHVYRRTGGGNLDVYVDRGTGSERKLSMLTSGGIVDYPSTSLVAGNLSAGTHTIEIETTSAGPVSILGVTVVKP